MRIFRSGSISDEFAKSLSRNLSRKLKTAAYETLTGIGGPKWPNEKGHWPNPGQYTSFSSEGGRNEIIADESSLYDEHVFKNFPFRGKMYDLYVDWKGAFEEEHYFDFPPLWASSGRQVDSFSLFDPEIMTAAEYWTNAPIGGIKNITEFEKQKALDPNSPGVKAWQEWSERSDRALKQVEDLEKTITPEEKAQILNFIKQNDPALPAIKRDNERKRRSHEKQETGRDERDYDPDDSIDWGAVDAREWAGQGPLRGDPPDVAGRYY